MLYTKVQNIHFFQPENFYGKPFKNASNNHPLTPFSISINAIRDNVQWTHPLYSSTNQISCFFASSYGSFSDQAKQVGCLDHKFCTEESLQTTSRTSFCSAMGFEKSEGITFHSGKQEITLTRLLFGIHIGWPFFIVHSNGEHYAGIKHSIRTVGVIGVLLL